MVYVGGGRVKTTTAVPTVRAANAIPFKDGSICIAPGIAPRAWVSGIPYGQNGRICVDLTGMPVKLFVAGIGFADAGHIACDQTGAIHHYVRGIPITAEGRIAIQAPTA